MRAIHSLFLASLCFSVPALAECEDKVSGVRFIGADTEPFVRAVIAARDVEGNFDRAVAFRFPATIWGPFFEANGNERAFRREGLRVTIWTKERKVVFENFPRRGLRSVYLESVAYTETFSGIRLEEVAQPLERLRGDGGLASRASAFATYQAGPFGFLAAPLLGLNAMVGHPLGRTERLGALVQMSFLSYAMMNYSLFPNLLLDPEKVEAVEKTGPHELTVTYRRDRFPTHSRVQVYRFDPATLLLEEHRYRVAYLHESIRARHITRSHHFSDGIAFADRRRVRISFLGEATRSSPRAISADIGRVEVLYGTPE